MSQSNDRPKRLYPPSAAGERLGGTAEQTLAKWRCRGEGPAYVKIGSRVYYEESALDAYIASRRRTSTSEAT
jgi:hypothetical protein